ncbi:hypothetical protein PVAP13_9NG072197 [Panicum virgatum]|uniref:Uncharacterized protein n=1 Tax=Panicum virgatum TaxID=38727 RepID=A0A8T0MBR7_PANVG|nr:hypothetical protein PVAP13_9NG072197 [Panicum virgatum]
MLMIGLRLCSRPLLKYILVSDGGQFIALYCDVRWLQVETFTSHPGTEPFASDSDVTCCLLLLLIGAAQSGGTSGTIWKATMPLQPQMNSTSNLFAFLGQMFASPCS